MILVRESVDEIEAQIQGQSLSPQRLALVEEMGRDLGRLVEPGVREGELIGFAVVGGDAGFEA